MTDILVQSQRCVGREKITLAVLFTACALFTLQGRQSVTLDATHHFTVAITRCNQQSANTKVHYNNMHTAFAEGS